MASTYWRVQQDKDDKLAVSRVKLQDSYTPNNPCSQRPKPKVPVHEVCRENEQNLCKRGNKCKYQHRDQTLISEDVAWKMNAISVVRDDFELGEVFLF